MRNINTRHCNDPSGLALDRLEARCHLAASGAGAGAYFDGTYLTPYSIEATIDDQSNVVGTLRSATTGGATSGQPLSIDRASFLPGGRYVPHFRSSFSPYDSVNGSQFVNGKSYPMGWFSGVDAGYRRAEFAMLTERADDLVIADIAGSWMYQSIIVTRNSVKGAWGTLSISGTSIARTTSVSGAAPVNDRVDVVSLQRNGAVRLSDGQYVWASRSKNTAVAADLNTADGQSSISLVYRTAIRTRQQLVGGYRIGIVGTGDFAAELNGRSAAIANYYTDLRDDGTFVQYDLGSYDAGGRNPSASGTWSVAGMSVTLKQNGPGRSWTFNVSADGVTLIAASTQAPGASVDILCGSALRVAVPTANAFSVIRQGDGTGQSRLYELKRDGSWLSVDLPTKAGGPAITGKVVTWTDPKDGLVYAAAQCGESLVLYRNDINGSWSHRNLTSSTPGSVSIAKELNVLVDAGGKCHLTGLDVNGDLICFSQADASPLWGDFAWVFVNIAERDLRPHGEVVPLFAATTITYATSWGGLNVAGLDAQGNIWSVWWAPGVSHWASANLTAAFGSAPLAGGLTAYLTPWGGINIAGLDSNGQIQVTWWVPAFGGEWKQSNLTASTNGPRFTAASVSSYVSAWGGLNIAGVDRQSGAIKVYWWSPALGDQGWAVTGFEEVVGISAPRPTRNLEGVAGPDSSLNVFGTADSGAYVRYCWYPQSGGTWQSEVVSVVAQPA